MFKELAFKIKNQEKTIIKLAHHTITINVVDPESKLWKEQVQSGEGENHIYGCWIATQSAIFIRNDLPKEMFISTLFHEIFHAIEDLYEVKIRHQDLNLMSDMMANIFLQNFLIKK